MAIKREHYTMADGKMVDYEGPFGFGGLLDGRMFNQILADYRKNNPRKVVVAADVAGYGFVFDGMKIDRGLAIAMETHPKSKEEILVGNMFEPETWKKAKRWLGEDQIALALCRPLKAFGFSQDIPRSAFIDLVDSVTSVLGDGGKFFTQVPLSLMLEANDVAGNIRSQLKVTVRVPEGHMIEAMEITK